MDQKDNKFQSTETRTHFQGQERSHHQGHEKIQQTAGISFIVRKAEKLTTALYMVTDILPEKEPMKWKAREAGVELLSDIMVMSSSGNSERMTILRNATKKIEQIVSFLDIAQGTRMMSEMNASVLKKEYLALKDACLVEWQHTSDGSKNIFTESFFEIASQVGSVEQRIEEKKESDTLRSSLGFGRPDLGATKNFIESSSTEILKYSGGEVGRPTETTKQIISQGHHVPPQATPTREHQQGRNVMHGTHPLSNSENTPKPQVEVMRQNIFTPAISKVAAPTPRTVFAPRATITPSGIIERPRQDIGRDDRRKIILALIKQKPTLTVKDIAKSIPGVSEKTIQRELFAMVTDGVLTKKGDRRWSTYALVV